MTDKKEKRKRGGQPKYPGEEQQRLSVIMRPRYKKVLEMLSAIRGTSISEAMELAIADFTRRQEVDGKPLLDYVRPANESFQRYRYDARDSLAFEMDGADFAEKFFIFKETLEERRNIPPSLRGQFDDFATEVLSGLETLGLLPTQWFKWDALLDAIREDWKEGKSIDQTASTLLLAMKFCQAEHIYSYRRGDAGTLPPEQDTVQLSAPEMAAMEKMLDAPDWIRYRDFFKVV